MSSIVNKTDRYSLHYPSPNELSSHLSAPLFTSETGSGAFVNAFEGVFINVLEGVFVNVFEGVALGEFYLEFTSLLTLFDSFSSLLIDLECSSLLNLLF